MRPKVLFVGLFAWGSPNITGVHEVRSFVLKNESLEGLHADLKKQRYEITKDGGWIIAIKVTREEITDLKDQFTVYNVDPLHWR